MVVSFPGGGMIYGGIERTGRKKLRAGSEGVAGGGVRIAANRLSMMMMMKIRYLPLCL